MSLDIAGGQIVNSGSVANMSATFTSSTLDISGGGTTSVHVIVSNTASAVGRVEIQVSNDGTNFPTYVAVSVLASGGVNSLVDYPGAAKFLRIRYTRTSGDGILDVHVNSDRNYPY